MDHTLVNWIQIPVRNIERAAQFYSKVLGVEFFFEELRDKPHAVFKAGPDGKMPINGALVQFDETDWNPGRGPILFFDATGKFDIMLDHIEANGGTIIVPKTLIKSEEEGGTFLPRTYIDGEVGYFAHFTDSEGNRLGLYGPY